MDYTIIAYSLYLVLTIGLTMWVANTLFKNGKVFLVEIFANNTEFADSVNKLLVVGFYLINLGYAVSALDAIGNVHDLSDLFIRLSKRVGIITLILGAMHFTNIMIFFQLRKKPKTRRSPAMEESY